MTSQFNIKRRFLIPTSLFSALLISGCLHEEGANIDSGAQETDLGEQSEVGTQMNKTKHGPTILENTPTHAQDDAQNDKSNPRSISGYEPKMHWTGEYSYTKTDIESHDKIKLRAVVTEPAGPGPHPLIVMPSSWALNRVEYSIPARLWAKQGFVVISYTSRGFHRSGGVIDISGPDTVADVSSVIDWAGKHTKADLQRVGALGISYGGGTSLLAAAQDARIDAVASMSGWADLEASMIPNNTVANQISKLLTSSAKLTGKPGKLLADVPSIIKENRLHELRKPFSIRSAMKQVDKLDNTPVLIAHAWNDAAFPMSQMLDFYDALKGPKSIVMQPGDHATADMGGLLGLPNRSWEAALCWMKEHVAQERVDCGPRIVSISNDNKWLRHADSMDAWQGESTRFSLSDPWRRPILKFGSMDEGTADHAWSRSIETGGDTVANSGTAVLTGALLGFFSVPQMISPTFVLRHRALMWRTPMNQKGKHLVGAPVVKFNIKPQTKTLSLFVYLYEEVAGVASLITHAPMTFRELSPGKRTSVSLRMQPIDWHLVPGSKMVLVIDTKDPRYISESKRGQLQLMSTPDNPASIEVPLHQED